VPPAHPAALSRARALALHAPRRCLACRAHLKAENEHVAAVLADTEPLQEELYKEMRARIQEADQTVPAM
jgi:protease II